MENLLNLLISNKDWLFSGIGVVVLTSVLSLVFKRIANYKRTKGTNIRIHGEQIDRTVNVQVGGDIGSVIGETVIKEVESLLIQIILEQQNLFVRKSYGESATECFTWENLDRFKQENTIAKIQRNLIESGKFNDLVDMLIELPERRLKDIFQKGRYTFKKTWAELGEITVAGQTDAGQKAERMIAETVVEFAREQVMLKS